MSRQYATWQTQKRSLAPSYSCKCTNAPALRLSDSSSLRQQSMALLLQQQHNCLTTMAMAITLPGSSFLSSSSQQQQDQFCFSRKPMQQHLLLRRRCGPPFPGARGELRFRVRASVSEDTAVPDVTRSERAAGSPMRRPRLLLVSDLDSTMVDHTDPSHTALLQFNHLWASEYAHDSVLVFSTGRSLQKYTALRNEAPLLTPALCIFSVGTEIRYGPTMEPDRDWEDYLDDQGWDQRVVLEEVQRLNLRLQDESEIRPHKVSCQIDKKDATAVIDTLSRRLKDRGLNVKLIFSHGIDLDVLPKGAGKGEALAFLLRKMKAQGWAPQETLVCGDSGNDIELFEVEGVNGVIVGGAMEELKQWYNNHGQHNNKLHMAKERCAGGIVEALEKLSLGPHLPLQSKMNSNGITNTQPKLNSVSGSENTVVGEPGEGEGSGRAQREVVEFVTFLEKWMNGEVGNDAGTFQRLTSVIASECTMVYPSGVEINLLESITAAQSKHGLTKHKKLRTWVDCIQEHKLADGAYMVTLRGWQMSQGTERQGYFATAVLREKEGTPNGFEWLRLHETQIS